MDNNKVTEIFSDKALAKELMALEDNAAVQAALKAKGLDLTDEEVQTLRNIQAKVKSGEITAEHLKQLENGEIPEELLELVSGGIVATLFIAAFYGGLAYGVTEELLKDDSDITAHEHGASGGW